MSQILGPEQAPDHREKISRAIRSGNLAVHALLLDARRNIRAGDLVRTLGWSSAIAREHGAAVAARRENQDVPAIRDSAHRADARRVKFFQMAARS